MTVEPHAPTRLELIRAAVEIVGASAIAMTHVAGAIGAIVAVRRRTRRCG